MNYLLEKNTFQIFAHISMKRVGGQSLIRFCLGTAAGLRSAVTIVSPLERLQRS